MSASAWVSLQVALFTLLPCCGAMAWRYKRFSDPAMRHQLEVEAEVAKAQAEKRQKQMDKKRKAGKIKDDPIA